MVCAVYEAVPSGIVVEVKIVARRALACPHIGFAEVGITRTEALRRQVGVNCKRQPDELK